MSVALACREAGSGSGVPVVLLHAFPLHSAMWEAQCEGLADVCHVVTPDLRGFGRSPLGDDDPSVDVMADDVAALLDRLDLASSRHRAVLGGLSMGGYVVMAFLRRHPERVAAVVLASTKAGADPEPARANRERIAQTVLRDGGVEVLVDDVLPGLVGPTTKARRPEVLATVRALLLDARPAAVAWAQRAMAGRRDSFPTLRGARVPALVLVGEEDELAPLPEAQAMAEALPQSRLVRVPEAGHLSAMENPEAFTAALREFALALPR